MNRLNIPLKLDGHFWVVRNGEVIDPTFPSEKYICLVNNCDYKKGKVYLPCPDPSLKNIILGVFMKCGKFKNLDEVVAYCDSIKFTFTDNMCIQNAIYEAKKNGGEIVFGSMGFYRKNGGIHYEYGGENYKTLEDFKLLPPRTTEGKLKMKLKLMKENRAKKN